MHSPSVMLSYLNVLAADSQTASPGSGSQFAAIFIPLAVAVVSGAFALISGRTHPTIRIKNLIEISKDVPDSLHVKYATERLILREISRLDVSTAGWYRKTFALWLSVSILVLMGIIAIKHPAAGLVGNILMAVIGLPLFINFGRKMNAHNRKYKQRYASLKTMEIREVTEAGLAVQRPQLNNSNEQATTG